MQNELIRWLEEKRGQQSVRQLAKTLSLSHTHVADVLKGKQPVTWNFAAAVAIKTGLEPLQAFEMAGLLPKKN